MFFVSKHRNCLINSHIKELFFPISKCTDMTLLLHSEDLTVSAEGRVQYDQMLQTTDHWTQVTELFPLICFKLIKHSPSISYWTDGAPKVTHSMEYFPIIYIMLRASKSLILIISFLALWKTVEYQPADYSYTRLIHTCWRIPLFLQPQTWCTKIVLSDVSSCLERGNSCLNISLISAAALQESKTTKPQAEHCKIIVKFPPYAIKYNHHIKARN